VREHAFGESIAQRSRRSQRRRLVDECAWGNTAASVGEYEEAPRPHTLNAAKKKYLLLISTDLIGLEHLYADSHIRQIPIANS